MIESERARRWASTMEGHAADPDIRLAHAGPGVPTGAVEPLARGGAGSGRERPAGVTGATRASGAGQRARAEEPDPFRTCFERDRDRILHSTAFRRLAGKTQVFVFPDDHQRTRLTHALEVAQVATAVARATRLNVALTEAIALGHDCGHGPGGHASEEALSPYLDGGYDHAVWGADVVLEPPQPLRRDARRDPQPLVVAARAPSTPEGAVVSWADRCAYSAHDLEDAVRAGVVSPVDAARRWSSSAAGRTRGQPAAGLHRRARRGHRHHRPVGMRADLAEALAALRAFNYEHIYLRPASVAQAEGVIAVLQALVEHFADRPNAARRPTPAAWPPAAPRRYGRR